MDIKKFVIIDWIERDMLLMKRISTSDNFADAMTKPMGRQLHYRHMDYILGKLKPKYVNSKSKINTMSSKVQPSPLFNESLCSVKHRGGNIHNGGRPTGALTLS